MAASSRRAFTLVEILVSMAIVIALAGIVASVYVRAIDRAKVDVEISQMHQIGLAANLYHEQYDAWPMSTTQLVDSRLITKEICLSPRDRYRGGFANAWLTEEGSSFSSATALQRRSIFPNTYFSVGDLVGPYREEFNGILADQPNVGLFVSILDSKLIGINAPINSMYEGLYRRVLLDSSVVIRHQIHLRGIDRQGKPVKFGTSGIIWFFDPTEQWIKDLANSI